MTLAERFMALFAGLSRGYGTYDVDGTSKYDGLKKLGVRVTHAAPVTLALYEGHLTGKRRIGIVPIRDDSTAVFGAFDVDVYGENYHADVARRIRELDLPLVVCRSKSGGLHAYLFTAEPVPAELMVAKLNEMSATLGYGGVEVFPKQTKLLGDRGDIGNWINMPYFSGDDGDVRAVRGDGSLMGLADFLDYADSVKQTASSLLKLRLLVAEDFKDGPPCLQVLAAKGFIAGTRNDSLFNLAVFAQKAMPDTWVDFLHELNERYMKPPLARQEVDGVAKSATRKGYCYACGKPPIKQHCNMSLCRTRKFGIGPMTGMPEMRNLTKYDSVPPVWFLDIEEGGRMELRTEDLQSPLNFQRRCMEVLNSMPPILKRDNWQEIINTLMKGLNIIPAPADASPAGQMLDHLERFCTGRAQAKSKEELLLPEKPWHDSGRHYFKLSDFMAFLDRHHFRDFKPAQVASLMQDRGGENHIFSLKGKSVKCWSFPEFAAQMTAHELPHIEDKEIF